MPILPWRAPDGPEPRLPAEGLRPHLRLPDERVGLATGWSRRWRGHGLGAHAATPEDADLILLNTCAVREKAEQKLLSALGRYRELKARRGALIAVGGCVAQQEKERLLTRVPYVDFVFGPDHIGRLPELVDAGRPAGALRRDRLDGLGGVRLPPRRRRRRPAAGPAPSSPP